MTGIVGHRIHTGDVTVTPVGGSGQHLGRSAPQARWRFVSDSRNFRGLQSRSSFLPIDPAVWPLSPTESRPAQRARSKIVSSNRSHGAGMRGNQVNPVVPTNPPVTSTITVLRTLQTGGRRVDRGGKEDLWASDEPSLCVCNMPVAVILIG